MGRYLDFEDERYEKGFEPFQLNAENIKANKGRKICYLLSRDIDRHRGYFIVRRGVIHFKRYSRLFISEEDSIDIRDVVECGIEIQEQKTNTL